MKMLLLSPSLGYRGSEKYVVECARIYRAMRLFDEATQTNEIHIIAGSTLKGRAYDMLVGEGFDVRLCTGKADYLDAIQKSISFSPDFVHIHRGGWYDKIQGKALKGLHDAGIPIIETNIFGRLDYLTGHLIDVHLHISLWDLSRWNARKRMLPAVHKQFGLYLPNCLDTESIKLASAIQISEFKASYALPSDALIIGRIGKTDWKTLAPAVKTVLEKIPHAYFISVDDYSHDASEISAWSEFTRSKTRIIPPLVGESELATFYSSCSLTLATSKVGESFGYVIAEAMACSTPVLSILRPNADNAQLELIQHGKGGWIARSTKAFGILLMELCANPDRIYALRANDRPLIETRYARDVIAKELEKLVRHLLNSPRIQSRIDRTSLIERLKQDFTWTHGEHGFAWVRDINRQTAGPAHPLQYPLMLLLRNPFASLAYESLCVLLRRFKRFFGKLRPQRSRLEPAVDKKQ